MSDKPKKHIAGAEDRLQARAARNKPIGEALAKLRAFRFDYARQEDLGDDLDILLTSFVTNGGPAGNWINAEWGAGKTIGIETYAAEMNAAFEDGTRLVLVAPLNSKGTVSSVPESILAAFNCTRPDLGNDDLKWNRVLDEIEKHRTRLLVLDEFDSAFRRPTMSAAIANTIRTRLIDPAVVAVSFCGSKGAREALRTVPHLLQRLGAPVRLPLLDWNEDFDKKALTKFLAQYDQAMVEAGIFHQISDLADPDVAQKLCIATNGTLRILCRVLETAAIDCLRRKRTRIGYDDLEYAVDDFCMAADFIKTNPFDRSEEGK